MIIQNSLRLLEQLSELELKIQKIEALMDELGINEDREKIIRLILSK
jgi:ribosome assembly protein YihI (activator of Der GTPase)